MRDRTPETQPRLGEVDPIVKTAVAAAEDDDRPLVLVCCPMAIEFECVKDELTNLAREHVSLTSELSANIAFMQLNMQLYTLKELDLPNVMCWIFTRKYLVIQTGLAARTMEIARQHLGGVGQAWLLGFAGSLDPSLKVGDAVEPNHLRHGEMGDRVTLEPLGLSDRHEGMVTINDVASSPNDKRSLRRQFDCFAVDMEAFLLAKLCEAHGIPFHTARAISDAADETLPKELAGVILPSGDLSLMRLAWVVMKKPTLVAALYRLWKNSRKAKKGLRLITRRLVEKLA